MTGSNNNNNESQSQATTTTTNKKLNVLFLHLDLGIGGAEQLVLQLATSSLDLGHDVTLLTTRCDQDHCFQLVKLSANGRLATNVKVWGRWIPHTLPIIGGLTAFFSNVRVLYLAFWLCWQQSSSSSTSTTTATPYDLIVLDVLPSPLWLLQYYTNFSLLFYCHFPDKLLIRNNNNNTNNNTSKKKSMYRWLMDTIEESCIPLADVLLVNSKFTKQTVMKEFPSLQQQQQQQQHNNNNNDREDDEEEEDKIQILYPALDTKALDSKPTALTTINSKDNKDEDDDNYDDDEPTTTANSTTTTGSNNNIIKIVSLNRYERKKKIELILQAYSLLRNQYPIGTIQVVIAGGYDTTNIENVEYRGELQSLAFDKLRLIKGQEVVFLTSISDTERTRLLREARCVVYTPPNEHFGIVPLEVMYSGTPVVACNSGGPLETVVHEKTGFLCEPTPENFANAINCLLKDPHKAKTMGIAGRQHVVDNFGSQRLQQQWDFYTTQAHRKGQQRVRRQQQQQKGGFLLLVVVVVRVIVYIMEALGALVLCWLLTIILRQIGLLESEESILGSVRRKLFDGGSDEL